MAVSVPYLFVNGTAADADEVNQNFDALVDFTNTSVMFLDGSTTFTGNVDIGGFKLLRVDTPTADTDGANKLYADSVIPVGVIQMFGGDDLKIPPKWVKCNGQELNRTTYQELYAVIGNNYGGGNGVDTFNVPNMTGDTATGSNNSGDGEIRFPSGAAPGVLGGDNDAPIIAHTHVTDVTGGAHGHGDNFGATQSTHAHNDNASGADTNGYVYWSKTVGSGNWALATSHLDWIKAQSGDPTSPWAVTWATSNSPASAGSITVTGQVTDSPSHDHVATTTGTDDSVTAVDANMPAHLGFTYIIRTGV